MITTRPRHRGFSGRTDDRIILRDGETIGGVYYCTAENVPRGRKWASWGPAGLSMGHPTREAAIAAQAETSGVAFWQQYGHGPGDGCDITRPAGARADVWAAVHS
jgi:hypothetical protein